MSIRGYCYVRVNRILWNTATSSIMMIGCDDLNNLFRRPQRCGDISGSKDQAETTASPWCNVMIFLLQLLLMLWRTVSRRLCRVVRIEETQSDISNSGLGDFLKDTARTKEQQIHAQRLLLFIHACTRSLGFLKVIQGSRSRKEVTFADVLIVIRGPMSVYRSDAPPQLLV